MKAKKKGNRGDIEAKRKGNFNIRHPHHIPVAQYGSGIEANKSEMEA